MSDTPATDRDPPVQDGATLPQAPVGAGEAATVPQATQSYVPGMPATAPLGEEADAFRVSTVHGYEILDELGRGGMGVVYKARHIQLQRLVALKMILAGGHAGADDLARFRTEGEAIARLQHPNIVQVFEVGDQEGKPYFSLEFCGGGSLARKIHGTPLPPKEAAGMVETLARAMDYAHGQGVVHRDLKPANILVASGGREPPDGSAVSGGSRPPLAESLKITDFGLARKLDEAGQTLSGTIMGTPSYMAPEQAGMANPGRKAGGVGPAADTYALGAILYELLTGRPPFKAATPLDTVLQVVNDEPVPPTQLQSKTPKDLETICLTCLRKDPARRYASALALAQDLHRYLADEPIAARPVGWRERFGRWCRRNPVVATMSAVVGVLLVLIAAGLAVAAFLLNEERLRAQASEKQAQEALKRTLAAEKEKTEQLWQSYLAQARALRWSDQMGRRFQSLAALHKAAVIRPTVELRNEAVACLALVDLRVAKEWEGCPGGLMETTCLFFDSKLQRYARSDAKGNISVRRVADDQEIVHLPGPGQPAWVLEFSPDGTRLAALYYPPHVLENEVCLWDLAGGKKILHLSRQLHLHGRPMDFSPDSRLFAIGHQDRSLRLYDTATGEQVKRLVPGVPPYMIRFHPTGQRIAVSGYAQRIAQIRDVATGTVISTLTADRVIDDLAWHSDGELLAGACEEKIYLWEAATGQTRMILEGRPDKATTVTFNHAGDLLASTGWDGTVNLWNPASGQKLLSVANVASRGRQLQFSPDDQMLGYNISGTKVQLWQVARGQECLQLYGTGQRAAAFHPNERLAAVADDQGVRLWDLACSKQLAFLPLQQNRSVLFHPGGKSLITSGSSGLQRWPIQARDAAKEHHLQIGPPQVLWTAPQIREAALSPDGARFVAASAAGRGILGNWEDPNAKVLLGDHPHMTFVSISPDTRWVATGTWNGFGVTIWDAATGALVHQLPAKLYSARVQFSPDGRWLVTSEPDEYRFWEVGLWKPGRRLARTRSGFAGPIAFSPDGSMAALAASPNTVHLIDVAGEHDIAVLAPPDRRNLEGLCFSADGSRLAVSAHGVLQVWDLRLIRARLAELGLDWNARPYPPAGGPANATRPEPLQIEVLGRRPGQ